MTIDKKTLDAVAFASKMLIRAGAALGALSKSQQVALADATDGVLPNSIAEALEAVKSLSPTVAQSMRTHPPLGLATSPGR